jgi:N-dimethylarginine dimethylaminohydrolase
MMNIQFLYFEDCPSHDEALNRLREVMHQEGIEAGVVIIKVETEEQAQELKFVGSPTILINGHDIIPVPQEARYYLSCRVYKLEDGRISPLPSHEMIRSALLSALENEHSEKE